MTRRTWSITITLAVIFGTGLVAGLWLNRRPPTLQVTTPPQAQEPYKALESSEAIVMKVYRDLSPSVVNIVATSLTLRFWMRPVPQQGQGSGFVIDPRGYIITNNHVVANAQTLEVTFAGGKKVSAQLVGRDPQSDLAVIKVEPFSGMVAAPLGDSEKLVVGQRVIALGNPFGFQNTVTTGFISALNRDMVIDHREMMGMIQTDAAINPGNSGGPLIDAGGRVIGINTAIYTQSGGFMGIALAMPINRAKKVAAQIMRFGRAIYPWLGIKFSIDLVPDVAKRMGLPPVRGILIYQVAPGSPAAMAGLRGATSRAVLGGRQVFFQGRPLLMGGDVILALDGVATPTFDEYRNLLLQKAVGTAVRLKVLREKKEFTVDLTTVADPRMQTDNYSAPH